MLRLAAPGDTPIAESKTFEACYGGTEANVLACLSGFGNETKYLSALPDNELGQAVLNHLHSFGIDTSSVVIGGSVLGMYFVENGMGSRGSNVIYNRAHSEITKLDEDAFDYDEVFAGADLFHVSGISFALSQSSRRLAFRLVKEAKAHGVKVSFDFNYRRKLWDTDTAGEIFRQIVPLADIVLASTLDLTVFLKTDAEGYFKNYQSEYLVLRDRTVLSSKEHKVSVRVIENRAEGRKQYAFSDFTFPVKEKIGGGDAFDGAFLHGLLKSGDTEYALKFAVAAFALKHQIKGDTFTEGESEVIAYAREMNINL